MKERIKYWDLVKGVLIFLVVLGHVLNSLPSSHFTNTVYLWIYSFHMPLFIFIAALFFEAKSKTYVKKKPSITSCFIFWGRCCGP